MSMSSDHVVVPYTVFAERRERRNRIAETLQDTNANDERSPSAIAVGEKRQALEAQRIDAEQGDGI
jgi:hypothetical protein